MKNKKIKFGIIIMIIALTLFGCSNDDSTQKNDDDDTPEVPDISPNILLIIADDMGKDATFGFSEGSIKPSTPNINTIKNNGLSFSNFWIYPTCSPARASIITGKYGYRTGVKIANDVLSTDENVLQNYISQNSDTDYSTAVIGKWHLDGYGANPVNPEDRGIDYYSGVLGGAVGNYTQWTLTEDLQQTNQTEYVTEKFTDLAIDWVAAQDDPWFLWLAYTAPHTPFHLPPSDLHSQGNLPEYVDGMDATPYYMAAIEAMDNQIGRLLESIPQEELENTIVIFVGDNGTPNQVAQSPYSSNTVKGSLNQGGINTPLFVAGVGVSRTGTDDNLITSTDLFSTISQLAGVSTSEIYDSKSFMSLLGSSGTHRDFQYSEMDNGNKDLWAISDGNYKLIVNANGNEEMYDLTSDPYEQNDLTGNLNSDQQTAKTELENELLNIRQ